MAVGTLAPPFNSVGHPVVARGLMPFGQGMSVFAVYRVSDVVGLLMCMLLPGYFADKARLKRHKKNDAGVS